jgi:hypothetical protein
VFFSRAATKGANVKQMWDFERGSYNVVHIGCSERPKLLVNVRLGTEQSYKG